MFQYPDNLLSHDIKEGLFLTELLSKYESNKSTRFYIKYKKLRSLFNTHKKFIDTLFHLEKEGFYELKGLKSVTGPYFDVPYARKGLLASDKKDSLEELDDLDIEIDYKKISSLMHKDRSPRKIENKEYEIKKITLFKDVSRNGKVIINDNYRDHVLDIDFGRPTWELLLRLADGEEVEYVPNIHQTSFDYLNHNKASQIYTHLKSKPQKLLKIVGGTIKPCIKIERISEKAFKTRLNKK
ncbi:hypothetical protein HY311_00240 [Candidatus Nomurabacteria bacterium]|nr:hypothetical protein [Candidatus Nomurabacteria bacterium]